MFKLCKILALKCLCLIIFNLMSIISYSQNSVLKHYGVSQGLPSSECYWIMQDSKGYMWIATDAGVVKYDGYKFKTYNSSKGLPDNTVFKIHEDKYGRIWFATYSGQMAYYSHKTDSIYGIEANKKLVELIKIVPTDFTFDDKDTLFISASRNGYIKLSPPEYNVIRSYEYQSSYFFLKKVGKNNFIYGNKFYFSKSDSHIIPLIFEPNNDFTLASRDTLFKMPRVVSYVSAIKKDDRSYLFSDSKTIIEVSEKGKAIVLDSLPTTKNAIITIYKDHSNRVWVNTHSNGTFLYSNINFNNEPQQFLKGLSVTTVFEDSDKGIWITTLEDGIYYIPTLDFLYLNKDAGLSFDKVYSVSSEDGKIFCLTADGCVNVLDVNTREIAERFMTLVSPVFLHCFNKKLLICSVESKIIDVVTKQIIHLTVWNSSRSFYDKVRIKRAINYDEDFLLGCYDGSIMKINRKTARCHEFISGLPTIFSMHNMGQVLWIGTKTGLYSYENKTLKFHGGELPLLKNRVEDMAHIGNKLFLATRGYGILCLENNKITQSYTEANGLASNLCKSIITDTEGNLWIGTNRGISRLKKGNNDNYIINTINLTNGLISNEINQIVKHDNTLYFATNKGLGVINVNDAFNPGISIPIYIEDFSVNNTKRDFTKDHFFRYDENFIKINYKGVCVKAEGDINYKFRLEGLDTSWTYSKNTFVQYTTLPPGKYKFVVYALNTEGKPSNIPAIIHFTINTPFWKTWWFIFTTVSIILFVIYFLYRRRVLFIEKQEKEKTESNKMIIESELKALRAQMNPHFMFNAINSIQSFVLKNDSKSAQKYLTKFARLIRSVLENSKYESISLSKEIDTLSLYIELECLRASFSFDYDIIIGNNVITEMINIPPMLIQPYIENAILHGLIPLTERRGKLTITFSQKDSILICTIDDNGIGRVKAIELKAKKSISHQSMGMSVTQNRLDILNQNNQLKTTVLVIDKEIDNKPVGTQIEISIDTKNLRT